MNRQRVKRVAAWSGGVIGLLLLLVVALLAWVLFTTSGARWVASTVTQRFVPQVAYAALDGTIAGELRIRDLRFEGGADTARICIADLTVDPTLGMLFSRRLRIERATVTGLTVWLPQEEKPDEPETEEGLWVEPPVEIEVRDFALEDGRILDGREQLVHVRQLGVAAVWTRDALVIERLALLPGDIEGSLHASGRITPQGDTVRAVLDARWRDVVIPEELAGRVIASAGELHVDGTPVEYTARGELDVGPPEDLAHVVLDVDGTDRAANLGKLEITQRAGRLDVTGDVEFAPRVAWNLAAKADDFNPGAFAAQWPGRIDLDFTTRGALEEAGPTGNLDIAALSGELRGRPLAGKGAIDFAAPSRFAGDLEVSSGRSRVEVSGDAGEAIDATIDLAVASLNDWVPDAAGSLTGRFRVRGSWPRLTIAGNADGRSLSLASPPESPDEEAPEPTRVASVRVTANVDSPLDPAGELTILARGIRAAGLEFASARVKGSGNQERHRVDFEADGDRFDASLALAGGITDTGWSGELAALRVDAPDVATLTLRQPARIVYDAGAFSVGEACFIDGQSSLCMAADLEADGAMQARYSFDRVPLGLANAIAPEAMPGQLRGEVRGEGNVRRTVEGQWFGEAGISSPSARLVMLDDQPGETPLGQQTLTLYENLELRATLEGSRAQARLTAALDHGGRLEGNLALGELLSAAPTLRGDVVAAIPTLAPYGSFVPTVANLDGGIDARVEIGGTTEAPRISGNVQASRLQADLGLLGIELREGAIRAEAAPTGGFTLEGQVQSGKGRLDFRGSMTERGVVDVRIGGADFLAADIPAARVIIAPDLALTGDPKRYLLEGEVTIPRADVNLEKMPRDEAPGASPDVVVVRNGREEQPEETGGDFPLVAEINVKLGDAINITGFGLESTVTGELLVREAPGDPTTGSGQLTVAGRFKKYGQDLTVEEGRLLFAGTPIDNPRLSIVAMREIDEDLSTGLRITGNAKSPVITVISDPEVGEADALSYLVTGRSLSDVGTASGTSQDALASATQSLQGAGAGLVAKRIGARLGLDEASVEENEMIGGSALTIGEYLSPRLYVSYGVGLFEPGEVIALRYKLNDDMGVKVERGSEETRAGVEYRIEK